MREIICGHPFVDGNKRTGFEVADTILRAKGYEFTASREEILKFLLELAMKGMEIEEIVKWLKSNTKKVRRGEYERKKEES